jgi:hypothetical protein
MGPLSTVWGAVQEAPWEKQYHNHVLDTIFAAHHTKRLLCNQKHSNNNNDSQSYNVTTMLHLLHQHYISPYSSCNCR